MAILNVLVLSTLDSNTMRPLLLVLLIIAVVLILTGCLIALVTLRRRLKTQNMENERT